MIAMSLAVYLCISGLVLLPFVLRYAFVVRHEKDEPRSDLLNLSSMMAKQTENLILSKFMRNL